MVVQQVNRESVQSTDTNPANSHSSGGGNKRDATNRILKLLNCWPTRSNGNNNNSRPNHNGLRGPGSRNHSSVPPDGTSMYLTVNGTIKEEKEENIEMWFRPEKRRKNFSFFLMPRGFGLKRSLAPRETFLIFWLRGGGGTSFSSKLCTLKVLGLSFDFWNQFQKNPLEFFFNFLFALLIYSTRVG